MKNKEEAIRLYNQGLSQRAVAETLGIGFALVNQYVRGEKIPKGRGNSTRKIESTVVQKNMLILSEKGFTHQQIGDMFNVDASTVCRAIQAARG